MPYYPRHLCLIGFNSEQCREVNSSPCAAYIRQWSGEHWFRQWLVAYSAPSRYLNQCWVIFNWTLRNNLQWNLNQNTNFLNPEMAAFLSRWVIPTVSPKELRLADAYMRRWYGSLFQVNNAFSLVGRKAITWTCVDALKMWRLLTNPS